MFRLGEWRGKDIQDPFEQPKTEFEKVLREIDVCVETWVERLKV